MTIEELLSQEQDQGKLIAELKSKRYISDPPVDKAKKQLSPLEHDVFNKVLRPDKKVKVDADDTGAKVVSAETEQGSIRMEPVARIGLALQRLIVKRAVSFLFGNPVTLESDPQNDNETMVLKAVNRVLYDIKQNSFNRKVARNMLSCTEVAEVWYPVPVEKTKTGTSLLSKVKDLINNAIGNKYTEIYGFKSKFKLRCAIFSPLLGDTLYPYFDDSGDMVAFSREFSITMNNSSQNFFETYTSDKHFMWKNGSAGFELVEGYPKSIAIGKIPVVFGNQESLEWEDVQVLIDRLEKLLSNFADTNDYHASPKIFITGTVKGFAKKGESGAIIQGDDNAKASYLSWENAPESVKLEIDTLLRMIYTITQTPDISFDAVKGMGAISGVALKLLFMDAHLKVADHQEVFDEYLQRRVNIIKAYIGQFNTSLQSDADNLLIEPIITPYIIKDEAAEIKIWTDANGGNPVMSQKASFNKARMTSDPDADYEQYTKEKEAASTFTFNEPTPA
jgi:hypothetical protein